MTRLLPALLLVACGGDATWAPNTWGEDLIESGLPSDVFVDGCSARYEHFYVRIAKAALVDGNDQEVAGIPEPLAYDMVLPGPHPLPEVTAPAGFYDTARFAIAPGAASEGNVDPAELDGHAVRVMGSVTCGTDTVAFDLPFDSDTTYNCEPDDLTLVRGQAVKSQLTIHGDHLFYDGLENQDAQTRGQAWVDADADGDGTLTVEELASTPIAPLGYDVGSQGDVMDLFAFVEALTRSIGHIDGEGHCAVR